MKYLTLEDALNGSPLRHPVAEAPPVPTRTRQGRTVYKPRMNLRELALMSRR
jgi:hypothetical protein